MSSDQRLTPSLDWDARLAVLLASYQRYWGYPASRQVCTRGDDRVDVYSFEPATAAQPHRYATVGMSLLRRADRSAVNEELMVALPGRRDEQTGKDMTTFLMSLVEYILARSIPLEGGIILPDMVAPSPVCEATSMVIALPPDEPEELHSHWHRDEVISVLQVYFVHKIEAEYARREGIDALLDRAKQSGIKLIDPRRAQPVIAERT